MRFLFFLLVLLAYSACSTHAIAENNYNWQRIEMRGEDYKAGTYYYGGSFAQRTDGKILVTYRIGNKVMLSYVDTEEKFLSESNASAENEWEFYTLYSSISDARLQKLNNGHILLYILEAGVEEDADKPFRLDVYESVNGLGTDFSFKSTIYTKELPYYCFGARAIGQAIEINGRILLPLAAPVIVTSGGFSGTVTSRQYCAVSINGGQNWTFSQIASDSRYRNASKGFGVAGERIFTLVHKEYATGTTNLLSKLLDDLGDIAPDHEDFDKDLPVWEYDESYSQQHIGDMLFTHIFWQPDGYTYMLRDVKNRLYQIFRRLDTTDLDTAGQTPYETGPIGSGATWEGPLNETAYGDDGKEFFSVTPSGHLAIYGTSTFGGATISHLYAGMIFSSLQVTPSAGEHGSISPSTPQIVADKDTVSFTIIPDKGYSIDTVNGCNGTLDGNIYTTGQVIENCTVEALFYETNSKTNLQSVYELLL